MIATDCIAKVKIKKEPSIDKVKRPADKLVKMILVFSNTLRKLRPHIKKLKLMTNKLRHDVIKLRLLFFYPSLLTKTLSLPGQS